MTRMDGKIAEKGIPQAVLLEKLSKAQRYANASKVFRFMNDPFRYSSAMWWQYIAFPFFKSEKEFRIQTFWDSPFAVRLPAGTDIYLSGAKTHPSELNLARFLIQNLNEGQCFWDIGSHFGYFTALAAKLCGSKGSVLSIEASAWAFTTLTRNVAHLPGVSAIHKAISDTVGRITFYEFPAKYSEFNSIHIDQYKDESWFQSCQPKIHKVEAETLDHLIHTASRQPDMIKIDVEGAEDRVFKGAEQLLQSDRNLSIIIEYMPDDQHNEAIRNIQEHGWKVFTINKLGECTPLYQTAEDYLSTVKLDSDNFILRKL